MYPNYQNQSQLDQLVSFFLLILGFISLGVGYLTGLLFLPLLALLFMGFTTKILVQHLLKYSLSTPNWVIVIACLISLIDFWDTGNFVVFLIIMLSAPFLAYFINWNTVLRWNHLVQATGSRE